jgi:hypothetical protein
MSSSAVAAARHEPERTCVACRSRKARAALMRVVRRPDGRVELDPRGRLPGRGAYLCVDGACWALALRRSAIERALRVAVPPELRARLEGTSARSAAPLGEPAGGPVAGGHDGP